VTLADGCRDLFVTADVENPLESKPAWPADGPIVEPVSGVRLDGDTCLLRWSATGELETLALCGVRSLQVGERVFRVKPGVEYAEVRLVDGKPQVLVGPEGCVEMEG